MKEHSRIRFNPVTQEIEVEGSESFVKAYFTRLQSMLSGSPGQTSTMKEGPKKSKTVPKKKATKTARTATASPAGKMPKAAVKKADKTSLKSPSGKRVTNIDTVVMLIRENAEGISTAELKEKTGLLENQIWNIVNRATKEGRVKKIKRGVYGAGEDIMEMEGPVIE